MLNLRQIALWKTRDEAVSIGGGAGGDRLFLGGAFLSHHHVFEYGCGEEDRLLPNHAYLTS